MSLLTQLTKGQITPEDFVVKAAADIQKDVKLFSALPGVSAVEDWALNVLATRLVSAGLSATLSELIVGALRSALGLAATPPQPGS